MKVVTGIMGESFLQRDGGDFSLVVGNFSKYGTDFFWSLVGPYVESEFIPCYVGPHSQVVYSVWAETPWFSHIYSKNKIQLPHKFAPSTPHASAVLLCRFILSKGGLAQSYLLGGPACTWKP